MQMSTRTSKSAAPEAIGAGQQRAIEWIKSGPKRLLIGGNWVEAQSGKTFETINPETEQHLVSVAEADRADVDAAVLAARRAFESPSWTGITPHARTRMLLQIADIVERHAEELAALE